MIVRNNRQVTRLFFALVIAAAALGFIVGSSLWQPDLQSGEISALADNGDWIDFIASLGEQVLQLFLGATSQ